MPIRTKPKTWAEQLEDLNDPAPKDFDPENDVEASDNSDGENESVDEGDPREHYIDVGKSNFRKLNGIELGPPYTGTSITRHTLAHEHDQDDPFGIHSGVEASEEEAEGGNSQQGFSEDREEGNGQIDSENEERLAGHVSGSIRVRDKPRSRGSGNLFTSDLINDIDREDTEASDDLERAGIYSGGYGDDDEEEEEDDEPKAAEMAETFEEESSQSEYSSASSALSSPKDDREALRKMMADEQKTVATSLSKAAKADIDKGRAVKRQRSTFDALLNTRIKLQKALVTTNTMSAETSAISADHAQIIQAAETAALTLWTSLNDLHSSLHKPNNPKKRPFAATASTSSSEIWTEMQSQESHFLPHRRSILTKWSQKTNPAIALSRQNKFSQAPTQQPLTSVLDQQLSGSNMERLIARTKIPRSCAPTQASQRMTSDENIYDDADFYTLLLRELVDQRMADSLTKLNSGNPTAKGVTDIPVLPSQRDLKVRRQVDTKASKGRKMRYTVHEKLQNFMAPNDRGTWGERQREELFASLLGRRVRLDEDLDGEDDSDDEITDLDGSEGGGLRLFG
ncbi:MAG: hypothetical protein Q9217_001644 [Psora testacea]